MRAVKKSVSSIHSFIVHEFAGAAFDPNWHFHPEYQLFCVVEGAGTRFVGDTIKPFLPGDLVMLGPDLPHLWRSDPPRGPEEAETARGIVVYFREDFLGREFFEKQEMVLLRQLFEKASRGLEVRGRTREMVTRKMRELSHQEGFGRVLSLLDILHGLALSDEYEYITSLGYVNSFKPSETERMRKVHEYVMGHFGREISLEQVAALTNMAPSAFCRYFKARANKTFSRLRERSAHRARLPAAHRGEPERIAGGLRMRLQNHFQLQPAVQGHRARKPAALPAAVRQVAVGALRVFAYLVEYPKHVPPVSGVHLLWASKTRNETAFFSIIGGSTIFRLHLWTDRKE
jgi:AraC-like DNA-binding protein